MDARFSVLRRGKGWAVVAKSGNIPCHPSGRYRRNTLEAALLGSGEFPAVHFASRLDRETSGCVLVATDGAAAGFLGKELMARRVAKTYLCVARGSWRLVPGPDGRCRVRGWICPAGDEIVRKYRVFVPEDHSGALPPGAQAAETFFRALAWEELGVPAAEAARLSSQGLVALECLPTTGRTHQIRATVKALGLDVVGDKLYGPDRAIYGRMCEGRMTEADRAALKTGRQALHAWRLSFRDPETLAPVECEAPPDAMLAEIRAAHS